MAVASPARPRPNTSRLFIIGGALLAALAFVLVIFLGGSRGGAGGGPTIKVVTAARDIPFRTPLTAADLQVSDWPQNGAPPGYYTTIDQVIGKQAAQGGATSTATNATGAVAEISIKQGQPVTQNMLATSVDAVNIQPAYLPIPKGFVALTIPTGEQIGVAGFIQPGDYINVIAQVNVSVFSTTGQQQGPPKSVTKTIFTNLHVLKVGPSTGQVSQGGSSTQATQSGGVASSLTVVMTECDAEYLKFMQTVSQLTYTLGSYQDYQPQDTKPDPACANANAAKGVGPQAVNSRWQFTNQQ